MTHIQITDLLARCLRVLRQLPEHFTQFEPWLATFIVTLEAEMDRRDLAALTAAEAEVLIDWLQPTMQALNGYSQSAIARPSNVELAMILRLKRVMYQLGISWAQYRKEANRTTIANQRKQDGFIRSYESRIDKLDSDIANLAVSGSAAAAAPPAEIPEAELEQALAAFDARLSEFKTRDDLEDKDMRKDGLARGEKVSKANVIGGLAGMMSAPPQRRAAEAATSVLAGDAGAARQPQQQQRPVPKPQPARVQANTSELNPDNIIDAEIIAAIKNYKGLKYTNTSGPYLEKCSFEIKIPDRKTGADIAERIRALKTGIQMAQSNVVFERMRGFFTLRVRSAHGFAGKCIVRNPELFTSVPKLVSDAERHYGQISSSAAAPKKRGGAQFKNVTARAAVRQRRLAKLAASSSSSSSESESSFSGSDSEGSSSDSGSGPAVRRQPARVQANTSKLNPDALIDAAIIAALKRYKGLKYSPNSKSSLKSHPLRISILENTKGEQIVQRIKQLKATANESLAYPWYRRGTNRVELKSQTAHRFAGECIIRNPELFTSDSKLVSDARGHYAQISSSAAASASAAKAVITGEKRKAPEPKPAVAAKRPEPTRPEKRARTVVPANLADEPETTATEIEAISDVAEVPTVARLFGGSNVVDVLAAAAEAEALAARAEEKRDIPSPPAFDPGSDAGEQPQQQAPAADTKLAPELVVALQEAEAAEAEADAAEAEAQAFQQQQQQAPAGDVVMAEQAETIDLTKLNPELAAALRKAEAAEAAADAVEAKEQARKAAADAAEQAIKDQQQQYLAEMEERTRAADARREASTERGKELTARKQVANAERLQIAALLSPAGIARRKVAALPAPEPKASQPQLGQNIFGRG